ncbi:hypothetical protein CKAH01_16241 [Colletotrichum kahawae]|uniref:Uncharacterized protein n=1 Tax=Colletotrichum kahawae TaxID=34407 RepID=A0AAE0D6Z8_COLKA|nr:hypothetical protein CKAH01_16241 [Colletotrichum kahawae]
MRPPTLTLSFISSLIQKGPRALLHCILSLDRPLSPSGVQSGQPPVIALFAASLAVMTNLMTTVFISPNHGGSSSCSPNFTFPMISSLVSSLRISFKLQTLRCLTIRTEGIHAVALTEKEKLLSTEILNFFGLLLMHHEPHKT